MNILLLLIAWLLFPCQQQACTGRRASALSTPLSSSTTNSHSLTGLSQNNRLLRLIAERRKRILAAEEEGARQEQLMVSAIPVAGVHDALSARIFASAAASTTTGSINIQPPVLFLSGFGVSATRLGMPDAGILTRSDMEDTVRHVVGATHPRRPSGRNWVNDDERQTWPIWIVDGDTGYGGAANVRQTIHSLAQMNEVAAVTIEDQIFPKKCTYIAGESINILDRDKAKQRIQCALAAKREAMEMNSRSDGGSSSSIAIIARTDCRNTLGLDEAISRCQLFEELGADIVYAEALKSPQEYKKLRKAMANPNTPMMLAQVQLYGNGREVAGSQQALYTTEQIGCDMGYDLALFGITALQAATAAMQETAKVFYDRSSGGLVVGPSTSLSSPQLTSFEKLKEAVGYGDLERFESDFPCE